MKPFMRDDFLLESQSAIKLYQEYASSMPIIDYHCHLSAREIYENKNFNTITEAWLYGDHYKWRAMRFNGIDERYITGDATDYEKFMAWAQTMEKCIGNPLYHWTHLELQRFFGICEPFGEKSAVPIWKKTNALLQQEECSARGMIARSNVAVICTTDDPTDLLEYHRKIREDNRIEFSVLPTFRPDRGMDINGSGFIRWVQRLATVTGTAITSYSTFLTALQQRMQFFRETGCRVADHSLEKVPYIESSEATIAGIFAQALQGKQIAAGDVERYHTAFLQFCGEQYARLGWAMQLHIGPMRNNNSNMFSRLGPDSGFDSIHDHPVAGSLSRLFDSLERKGCLPKTILYAINPKDYFVLGSMAGNFQSGGIPGKVQFGPAWWFNDTKTGMVEHMITLSNLGLISRFLGMVTDSRSFLSYPRHDYFRRILCNLLGGWMENGEVPADWDMMGGMVQDICFHNARTYFGFEIK
ncbi:metal-dependent hydrolase [Lucifera butyrica]|uniref:Uronate isomerase n=1 Tax=Lucifera butyrica TaxID=1351585 RepID=A0A498R3N4_9FIRM|nr:glucuronate isomerase [Lucifera butyrica]VBB05789.1 metal-dependent hydrolase [Lucifera butyrica]